MRNLGNLELRLFRQELRWRRGLRQIRLNSSRGPKFRTPLCLSCQASKKPNSGSFRLRPIRCLRTNPGFQLSIPVGTVQSLSPPTELDRTGLSGSAEAIQLGRLDSEAPTFQTSGSTRWR